MLDNGDNNMLHIIILVSCLYILFVYWYTLIINKMLKSKKNTNKL